MLVHPKTLHFALRLNAKSTHGWQNPETPNNRIDHSIRLDVGVVRDGSDGLGGNTLDDVSLTGHAGLTLQVEVDALLLGLALLLGVLLDTLDEVLTGTGVLDVLDADVDALLHVAVADNLVEEDTDGGLGHVVDDTGLSVESLVGHTRFHVSAIRPFSHIDGETGGSGMSKSHWAEGRKN